LTLTAASCALVRSARADGYAQDHLAVTRVGLGLAIELNGLHGAPAGLFSDANARLFYRPTLFANYRLTRCAQVPHCGFWVAGVDASAGRIASEYAAGELTVDVKKLWFAGSVEWRWVFNRHVALHARSRLGVAGTRLGMTDKVAMVSVSDWIARAEVTGLIGVRFFSLLVFEAGILRELPSSKRFHWGPAFKRVDTPDEHFQYVLRGAFEYRFGGDD
jgi:hypothetical protein